MQLHDMRTNFQFHFRSEQLTRTSQCLLTKNCTFVVHLSSHKNCGQTYFCSKTYGHGLIWYNSRYLRKPNCKVTVQKSHQGKKIQIPHAGHNKNKHCVPVPVCWSEEDLKRFMNLHPSLNLPEAFPEPSLSLPWTFPEPSLSLPWAFPEPSLNLP